MLIKYLILDKANLSRPKNEKEKKNDYKCRKLYVQKKTFAVWILHYSKTTIRVRNWKTNWFNLESIFL